MKWRGDISFKERSFGLVDNLVLSELAYIDFSGIIPSFEEGGGKTVRVEAELLTGRDKKAVVDSMPQEFIYLLSQSRRFQNALLSCYADEMDAVMQTQFSALNIRLEDGSVYVAFRGIGDEIVGWREDFGMSYQIMPAQKKAAEYL